MSRYGRTCLLFAAAILPVACSDTDNPLLIDLDGRQVAAFGGPGDAPRVFVFTSTECPISNRYAPEIRRLRDRFAERGVELFLVYPDPDDGIERIRRHLREYGHTAAVLRDPEHRLVRVSGARVTPEAAVFVAGELVYRGRIDDRYVTFGKTRPEPTTRDLRDAVEAVLAGLPVAVERTDAVGCFIRDLR